MRGRIDAAMEALSRLPDDHGADPTAAVLDAIPVTGAAVSTLGSFLAQETVAASDATAARIDELQFDLGEGPCWDAVAEGLPVLEPDLARTPQRVWPAFSPAVAEHGVGALFAFPLALGSVRVGALDLYRDGPGQLDPATVERAELVAQFLGRWVLRRMLRLTGDLEPDGESRHSRRVVHQAIGFVIAQIGVSADDAHLLIQARAVGSGRTMQEVAEDIVGRRLVFTVADNRIEEQ